MGFFLFIAMQKSDATLLETALRDNIPLKIVLGNSEQQTYITTFGHSQIPNRHYAVGEGVFTELTLAPEPKLVTTGVPKNKVEPIVNAPHTFIVGIHNKL